MQPGAKARYHAIVLLRLPARANIRTLPMPVFKYNNGSSVPNQITLVEGDTLTLKLDGQPHQGRARHFIIKSSTSATVEVVRQNADPKIREQSIVIAARSTGPTAILRAYGPVDNAEAVCKGVPDLACVPTVSVTVVPKITLPPENTDAGILARVLLAESLSPERDAYGDGEDVLKAMRKMRIVLENRLKAAQASTALKSYVACTPATMDFRGIIFANQCGKKQEIQINGFVGNRIHAEVLKTINGMVSNANNGIYQKFKLFRRHVEEAIDVATGLNLDNKPLSSASLLYWRTKDASTPSNWAILREAIAEQQFYSLTEGYLKNPDQPGPRP
jgi:hypothetical protein